MKKCYIAGKIGGLPESEYKANFEQAMREKTSNHACIKPRVCLQPNN